ncbi:hypothetical protein CEUSTIGMA_g12539.t1 [Chlamydomonas eustigma]|uniref:Putative auto-transporter adhesin head GIN domain-containing protein n=1 Tax=Chlamydomonas eustigma TaxID=1157962 RepID=A0A250XQ95_9CHLO|nr:hypothetical protein CEUSTIGMA_g12539.t1 [Chlamydomonas eustigma]|eukprot:GAX85119.1 hypothetical protein CEUSTIGMA_g12539.t1 [Chlamydomonas eustigma]
MYTFGLFFGLLMLPALSQSDLAVTQLPESFYAISSCLPYTLLLKPPNSTGTLSDSEQQNGSISINAEPSVAECLVATLDDGILTLSANGSFTSNQSIQITVTAAQNESLTFILNAGPGDVILSPGFSPPSLSMIATGTGSIYAYGIMTPQIRVVETGINTVFVNGSYETAHLTLSGASKAYLSGVNPENGTVTVSAVDISSAWIQGGPGTAITGSTGNLGKVLYTDGMCNVTPETSPLLGLVPSGLSCIQSTSSQGLVYTPSWTCGVNVSVQGTCAAPGGTKVPLNITNATAAGGVVPSSSQQPAAGNNSVSNSTSNATTSISPPSMTNSTTNTSGTIFSSFFNNTSSQSPGSSTAMINQSGEVMGALNASTVGQPSMTNLSLNNTGDQSNVTEGNSSTNNSSEATTGNDAPPPASGPAGPFTSSSVSFGSSSSQASSAASSSSYSAGPGGGSVTAITSIPCAEPGPHTIMF